MAIIRQKKRNLILAMLLGIVITAVPMGVYSGTVTYKKLMTDKEIKNLMEEINSEKVYTAYCLTRSMSKGELIRAEDLEGSEAEKMLFSLCREKTSFRSHPLRGSGDTGKLLGAEDLGCKRV